MTSRHPPVGDFATDFDHTDPTWVADPYPIWDDLRQRCPVAHSDRYGGAWLPVDPRLGRPRSPTTTSTSPPARWWSASGGRDPTTCPRRSGCPRRSRSDPPYHGLVRRMLLPAFTPRPIAALEPFTRELCRELLGRDARPDALRRGDRLRAAHPRPGHRQVSSASRRRTPTCSGGFIRQVLEERRPVRRGAAGDADGTRRLHGRPDRGPPPNPRDDLTSFLLGAEIGGEKLSGRARPRHHDPPDDRRDRHHLVGDRRLAVAPGPAPGGPPPAGRGARADGHRGRGTPARLRAGHDGTAGRGGLRFPRLPDARRATGCCCRSPRPTGTRPSSRTRAWSGSTGPGTGTPPSGWAGIAASAPTWPGWSCGSPWRNGWPATRTSSWPIPPPSPGPPGQVRGPRTLPVTIVGDGR